MGFNIPFYIIFGTNLLTEGPVQFAVFLPISVFRRKGISNGTKPSRGSFLEQTQSRRLGVDVKEATRRPRGRRARPPPSWAPRSSTDLLLSPIYTHIPWKHPGEPRNHFSTAATYCTSEIPSGDLFRWSAGGGFDHGGLLHQHRSLSDDVWVV